MRPSRGRRLQRRAEETIRSPLVRPEDGCHDRGCTPRRSAHRGLGRDHGLPPGADPVRRGSAKGRRRGAEPSEARRRRLAVAPCRRLVAVPRRRSALVPRRRLAVVARCRFAPVACREGALVRRSKRVIVRQPGAVRMHGGPLGCAAIERNRAGIVRVRDAERRQQQLGCDQQSYRERETTTIHKAAMLPLMPRGPPLSPTHRSASIVS